MLQVDARAWVARTSRQAGRSVGLAEVDAADIARIADLGFELVWLTATWKIGSQSRRMWRDTAWLREARTTLLPDGTDDEIEGSPDAIADYMPPRGIGGEEGLRVLRRRLSEAGIGLILDFVPNHTATDHPWVRQSPEWYVQGSEDQRAADPDAYFEVRMDGRHLIAHGRDPNFLPWRDTAQLDYRRADTRRTIIQKLRDVATTCDGVVCRMAMLVLDDVFHSTWDERSVAPPGSLSANESGEFWWHAVTQVRAAYPRFLLIGEAYWDLEWRLQRLGFDYTFDKQLQDRLHAGDPAMTLGHLRADEEYQRRSLRYLEQRGETPVAAQVGLAEHRSMALTAATAPGMLLLTDGQMAGSRAQAWPQIGRDPAEPPDETVRDLYERLMRATGDEVFRLGQAVRIDLQAAWPGNVTHEGVLARLWVGPHRHFRLVVVNLAPRAAQGYVPLMVPEFAGHEVHLEDLLGPHRYDRSGDDLLTRGLYLDLPAYGCHLFRISRTSTRRGRGRPRGHLSGREVSQ